jgi:hypothetical protein
LHVLEQIDHLRGGRVPGWADLAIAHKPEGGSPVNGYRKPRRKEIRRKSHRNLRKVGSIPKSCDIWTPCQLELGDEGDLAQ